jgi:hypothetical protein
MSTSGWPATRSPPGLRGGGAGGIRTLDRPLQAYNGLANRRLQPLGHSSMSADMPDARASRKRQIQITPRSFKGAAALRCIFDRHAGSVPLASSGFCTHKQRRRRAGVRGMRRRAKLIRRTRRLRFRPGARLQIATSGRWSACPLSIPRTPGSAVFLPDFPEVAGLGTERRDCNPDWRSSVGPGWFAFLNLRRIGSVAIAHSIMCGVAAGGLGIALFDSTSKQRADR